MRTLISCFLAVLGVLLLADFASAGPYGVAPVRVAQVRAAQFRAQRIVVPQRVVVPHVAPVARLRIVQPYAQPIVVPQQFSYGSAIQADVFGGSCVGGVQQLGYGGLGLGAGYGCAQPIVFRQQLGLGYGGYGGLGLGFGVPGLGFRFR